MKCLWKYRNKGNDNLLPNRILNDKLYLGQAKEKIHDISLLTKSKE